MNFTARALFALAAVALSSAAFAAETNPTAVSAMLNRIGGQGSADRFVTVLDETIDTKDGSETFVITSSEGKPCIKGSTISALTTGIGWYLNHSAKINVSWNNPHPDLTTADLPLPVGEETHSTDDKYRYYLNYCTFSYSMSTWTWDRWQEEIDWMALHGINMPLQIIGVEEVWRKFLMEDCGYTKDEVNDFVAGPAFMAWFSMNNLEGHGGPNPDWWYERQAQLGKQMMGRMHELGMEPVLPGFYQVPSNFASKTNLGTVATGKWCGFSRPHLPSVDNVEALKEYGAKYYNRLHEVLGESQYYSMDPFHEGGQGTQDYALKLYQELYNVMNTAKEGSQWVIQQWQWNGHQRQSLNGVPKGKLIVLDLNSERVPGYTGYNGHETVFSTIFNFGARTGFDGRFQKTIDEYFKAQNTASVKGIGATPEGIEQTPVAYDLLFELPWMSSKPDAAEWMAEYANRRYGQDSPEAVEAWQLLRTSALEMGGQAQPPHEAIICVRPSLTVGKVSSWGNGDIFYDRADVINAAYLLLDANLSGLNYSFDVTDIARQALTDYAMVLRAGINEANSSGNTAMFEKRRDAFLQLILDLDQLLNTNSDFMLGHWTKRARAMADEVAGTTNADKDWLELDNARTIISTWGKQAQANGGGLRDYSYREWGGMLKDYYYQRWKIWFDAGMKEPGIGWFQWEWNWAHSNPDAYSDQPVGDTRDVALAVIPKYLTKFTSSIPNEPAIFVDRLLTNDYKKKFFDGTNPGVSYTPNLDGDVEIASIAIDFSTNGRFEDGEIQEGGTFLIPEDAPIGERNVQVTLADGTVINYTVKILIEITNDRTVSVRTSDAKQGTVAIDGTDALSVTNKEIVSFRAIADKNYDFEYWEDSKGNNVGNDNPMNYYGNGDETFTAHFVVNKWGVPTYNGAAKDLSDMKSYKQYINQMNLVQGGENYDLYSASACPEEHFIQIPTRIKAAPGSEFTFKYTQPSDGMKYLYLSAYVDLNNDGKFKPEDGELLGTIGTHENTNNAVGAGTFTMLLPYDAELGTTHIRLRFDGAWNSNGWNATTNAFDADAPTNRVIYELILEVVESPEYACTVTYSANDTNLGSMRSENETMVYNPGDEVIITAFPNTDVRVKRWVDQHGRELPEKWITDQGRSLTFKTFDNAHITCEFEPEPMEVNNWKLNWMPDNQGNVTITSVEEDGDPVLNLSSVNVQNIEPGIFADKNLTDLTLPTSLVGIAPVLYTASDQGNGTNNKKFIIEVNGADATEANTPIKGTAPWVLTISGETGSNTFNQYGSVLFANGDNGTGNDYTNGWSQIYLKKGGILNVKWNSSSDDPFNNVVLNGKFTIVAEFNGSNQLTVTATNAEGKSQTKTFSNGNTEMKSVWRFVNCIPSGMNLTYTFTETQARLDLPSIFAGLHTLENVNIHSSSAKFKSTDGVLFDKDGKNVMLYPEGRLHKPFMLKRGENYVGTSPLQTGNDIADAAVADGEFGLHALWMLNDTKLTHVNSGLHLSADAAKASATHGEFTHSLTYGTGMPKLALNSHNFDFETLSAIRVEGTGALTVTLPLAVTVPADVKVARITGISASNGLELAELNEGDIIPANDPVLLTGLTAGVEFPIVDAAPAAEAYNKLYGTCVDLEVPGKVFVLDGTNFVSKTSGTIPANSAYLLATDIPAEMGETFPIDYTGTNTIITEIDGTQQPEKAYDLLGRPTVGTRPGIYIINGKKVRK